jgi:SAM-dependent methyltransferase
MTEDFWNKTWTEFEPFHLDPVTFKEKVNQSNRVFLNLIGEVNGRNVLDIGCGNGTLSVYLAKMGGKVTAIDNSLSAIRNTRALAKANRVDSSIEAHRLDVKELKTLGKSFDVLVGKFILHHIEPFDIFSEILFDATTKGGRGIFFENNSRNPILMFLRTFLAGRFGIPKYGDSEEYPFQSREIEMLKQRFDRVSVHYPAFMFFGLMGPYLLKGKKKLWGFSNKIDQWIYRHFPAFRKYSYIQILEVQKF